jgi:hypothetical protein
LQKSGGGCLLRRFKRLTLSLPEKGCDALAGSRERVGQSLANRVEMVRLAHAGRELGSVLPAVGEHNELAYILAAQGRNVPEKRIREHLRDFLETGPLAADRG